MSSSKRVRFHPGCHEQLNCDLSVRQAFLTLSSFAPYVVGPFGEGLADDDFLRFA